MAPSAKQIATFSTSVGLAMEEEMTPERMPHITLVSSVSSEREEWAGNTECECEHTAFCHSVCRRQEGGRERSQENKVGLTLRPVNQQSLEGLVCANFDCPIGGLAQHGRSYPVKSSHVFHHPLPGCPSGLWRLTTVSAPCVSL